MSIFYRPSHRGSHKDGHVTQTRPMGIIRGTLAGVTETFYQTL